MKISHVLLNKYANKLTTNEGIAKYGKFPLTSYMASSDDIGFGSDEDDLETSARTWKNLSKQLTTVCPELYFIIELGYLTLLLSCITDESGMSCTSLKSRHTFSKKSIRS